MHPYLHNLLMHSRADSLEADQSDESLTPNQPTHQARATCDLYMHWCGALMQVLAVLPAEDVQKRE